MDNHEKGSGMQPLEQNRQIRLVLDHSDEEGVTIDLGNVYKNLKLKKRIFAWVLMLCLTIGICVPLLLYQFQRPMLTVSSVVTLRYEVPVKILEKKTNGSDEKEWVIPENPQYAPVSDLSAPDGSDLDVNELTSSYVLQTALNDMSLSNSVTVGALRDNISIQIILTEESQRVKEALAGLTEAKSADAYTQLQKAEIKYQNRFVVSLTNGFGEEDSRVKTELTDNELRLLLDRILTVYNEYLVQTYADTKMPEDAFSMIDTTTLDAADSVDRLRTGIQALYNYCDEKTDTVKAYRSWQTGRSLKDWMETLETFRTINIDYLYSTVNSNGITRDKTALLTSWKYALRNAKSALEKVNDNIAETKKILAGYKNDEVFISQQESDAAKTTKAATEYYNNLVLQQTENYNKAAELKATILDYEDRIQRLEGQQGTAVTDEIEAELARSASSARELYRNIQAHMEELFTSQMYTTFEDHSAAQGKTESFLAASAKKMIIGGIVGIVLACGLWFLAALAPELSKGRKEETGKEVAAE